MHISETIRYAGVNDHTIDLFEGQYPVPAGMAYNSYVILDEKVAVMDSVEEGFAGQWFENLDAILDGRQPDYLVVHHMEPDHSGSIAKFMERYPQAVVVSGAKSFGMMKQFFGTDFSERQMSVKEGTVLELGTHSLTFIAAPMVHWPEVMMSYDAADKVLFSADAFGKFGALDVDEPWVDEARRYYIGIVGKFGAQVQTVLKKAAALDIQTICSLHGPVLTGNLSEYLNYYNTWSTYQPEEQGVAIAYTSVYGHTKAAVEYLAKKLEERGIRTAVYDLARTDLAAAVADAYRFDRLVLATTTYNAGIYPMMQTYLDHLLSHNFQNRLVAIVENGSWAPTAAKGMMKMLEGCKNLSYAENTVTLKGAMSEDSRAKLDALAEELAER